HSDARQSRVGKIVDTLCPRGADFQNDFTDPTKDMSMLAPDQTKPIMRPYLAAAQNFASGKATPREFLETSLELLDQWEPRIGAFVCTNVRGARVAATHPPARGGAGKPLSTIDGMPVGIKD